MTAPYVTPMVNWHADVAIVGGGVAGLTAARALASAGVSVLLFEARARLGGRVYTTGVAPDDAPWLDLGPAWCWPHQPQILALLETLGLRVFEQHRDGVAMYDQGPGRLGQAFDADGGAGPSLRILGGTVALTAALAESAIASATPAILVTGVAIHTITQLGGAPAMVQLDGMYTHDAASGALVGHAVRCVARRVIVAVPPRVVLRDLTFVPPLPAAVSATLRETVTWMGHSMKCIVAYDTPFWRESGRSGYAVSWTGPLQEMHDACTPAYGTHAARYALMGFVAPTTSADRQAFRTATATTREAAVLAQLARVFGAEALAARAYVECDWTRELLTSGAGDVLPPSVHPTYGAAVFEGSGGMEGWDGLLCWAGAETSAEEGGYLEGAVRSGGRAAGAVLRGVSRD